MGNRTSLGNEQYAVNKYIGTAYDHVKNVSENIEDVKIVADALGDDFPEDGLDTIVENVGDINTVVDNMDDVNTVAGNILEVVEVADNIDAVLDASNQAELARKWAQEAEDVEVLPNEYSAYHYSKKSEEQAVIATNAADSIGRYQGLWPDTGGTTEKGDTYQTQVSGTPTGQYFTALQNTTVDPVGDDVNWREVVSSNNLNNLLKSASGGITYPEDGNSLPTSQLVQGTIPQGVTRLTVDTGLGYGEVLNLWLASGDFSASSHSEITITKKASGLKGYTVITNIGTYEFVTPKTEKLREEVNLEGWGTPTLVNDTTAIQAAYDYAVTQFAQSGTIKFKGLWYLDTLNTYQNAGSDWDGNIPPASESGAYWALRGGAIPHIEFEGDNRANSQFKSVSGNPMFAASDASPSNYHEFRLKNCSLQGFNLTGRPVDLRRDNTFPYRYVFDNVAFFNFEYGFIYDRFEDGGSGNPINGYCYFVNCQFSGNLCGASVGGDNTFFENCWFTYNYWCNLWTKSGAVLKVQGGKIEYIQQGGWGTWTPPITGTLTGPFIWLCETGVESLNFDGVYFEPQSSQSANNAGYIPFGIYRNSLSVVSDLSFTNGCRMNGLGSERLMQIDDNVNVTGLSMDSFYIRNLKLNADKAIIGTGDGASVDNFEIASGRVGSITDSGGASITDWTMFQPSATVRGSTDKSKNSGLQSNISDFSPVKYEGVISGAGSILFGNGYTSVRISTGVYEVTLNQTNYSSPNTASFYAEATPFYRSQGPEQHKARVEPVSENSFRVYVTTSTDSVVDKEFSFSATIATI